MSIQSGPGESPNGMRIANQMKAIPKLTESNCFGITFVLYAVLANNLPDGVTISRGLCFTPLPAVSGARGDCGSFGVARFDAVN